MAASALVHRALVPTAPCTQIARLESVDSPSDYSDSMFTGRDKALVAATRTVEAIRRFHGRVDAEDGKARTDGSRLASQRLDRIASHLGKSRVPRALAAPVKSFSLATKIQYRPFGEEVPWGDPSWYQGSNSPYYNASHIKWRKRCRDFCEEYLAPNVQEWDESYTFPKQVFKDFYKAGLLPGIVGPPWDESLTGIPEPEGGFDPFKELILIDEIGRCGSGGIMWAMFAGISIGLPPILLFGSDEMKRRVAPGCLRGEKFICLAITEPSTGSDVANISTTAERNGDYFIVNGAKKWITNGIWSDYFTVAVRTGGKGAKGISMLLIERTMPGVTCRHMKCMGMWPSGTTYITFEDVKVPCSNLIGPEGAGFKQIMYNFNHERWSLICQSNRLARVLFEEAFKYSMQRETFGKKLHEHQVIRWKLAEMARRIEATHAWTESVTFQLCTMDKKEQNAKLGGTIALLKAQSSKVMEFCAREAAQIFGGASYVRGGKGHKVERLYREVRGYAIPGGSEEIMLDYAARDAVKRMARQLAKQAAL